MCFRVYELCLPGTTPSNFVRTYLGIIITQFSVPVQFTPNAKMRLVNSHQTLFLHVPGNWLGFQGFKEVTILGNSRGFQGNLKAFVWSFQRGTAVRTTPGITRTYLGIIITKFSVPVQFTPNAKMRLVNSHQTLFLHVPGNWLGFQGFKEVTILGNSRGFQGNLKAFVWSFQRGTPRWCLQRTTALR